MSPGTVRVRSSIQAVAPGAWSDCFWLPIPAELQSPMKMQKQCSLPCWAGRDDGWPKHSRRRALGATTTTDRSAQLIRMNSAASEASSTLPMAA
jgi:hypothetical protein